MVKWRTPAAAIDWLTAKHFQPYAASIDLSYQLRLLSSLINRALKGKNLDRAQGNL
jgi:hypothetical protein